MATGSFVVRADTEEEGSGIDAHTLIEDWPGFVLFLVSFFFYSWIYKSLLLKPQKGNFTFLHLHVFCKMGLVVLDSHGCWKD